MDVVTAQGEVTRPADELGRQLASRPGDRFVVVVEPGSTLPPFLLEGNALPAGATSYLVSAHPDVLPAVRHARPTVFAADPGPWDTLAVAVRTMLAGLNGNLDKALALGREVTEALRVDVSADAVRRYAAVASTLGGVRSHVGLDECRLAIAFEPLTSEVDALFCSIGLPILTDHLVRDHATSQLTSARGSGL